MSNDETMTALAADDLRRECPTDTFDFDSTEDVPPLEGVIGQERATRAISFGMDVDSPGYHVYALGEPGTGRIDSIKNFLENRSEDETVPSDWVYVNNFDDPDNPDALQLPAGRGKEFKEDMSEFVEQLRSEVPQAFESEDYEREQEEIWKEFRNQRQELFDQLEEKANEEDLTLLQTQHGIVIAPVQDGEVISPDDFNELDEDTREQYESARRGLQDDLRDTLRQVQELQSDVREEMRELDKQTLGFAIEHIVDELKTKYEALPSVVEFLEDVRSSLMDNTQTLKQLEQMEQMQAQMPYFMAQGQGSFFDKYEVNLLVDNADRDTAPVVHETNPTYYNLVGRIEHTGQFGSMTTDYTMIKNGALHRANGGYLILEAKDVLTTPFAWDALKRSLNEQQVKTESMGQEYRAIQTQTLEPETIPLDVKVVLIGNPLLYYMLYNYDEEFQKLFRVKADFDNQTDWDEETVEQYARYIGSVCDDENLKNFAPSGVARIVEEGARTVESTKKLDAKTGNLNDLVIQSSYWASQNGNDLVKAEDVKTAIDEKVYRSNRIEERIQERIDDGTILIDTEGEQVGQVNGLSVIPLGDYSFGKPSRITARTHIGDRGVVNIDRETEMGGQIHNKGSMILEGYLGGQFAQDIPLSVSASITFEQTYSGVEGDSASSTELYALLSSLGEVPIKQGIAVTGSVNQHGKIQAIGGVNAKIEGFFEVCRQKGLTGDEGVIIPDSNVQDLMLRERVVDAVRDGDFHIYPVSTVEEGLEVLTGETAGTLQDDGTFPEGTVKRAVKDRLRGLAETARKFGRTDEASE
jgi:lon-related putative ATP-dependent protease